MVKAILIGIAIGLLIGFIDSYSYAISGYTTAEISLIIIPFLVISFYKLLRTSYTSLDMVMATALAYGISITTTLTSGMYITFGFLSYVSKRLKVYGLEVTVPQYLFSGTFPDLVALPIYVSLALASFSGVLIAFAFRGHFIEKERLRYPIGFASAILAKFLDKASISIKPAFLAIVLGFILQLIVMRSDALLDLTPLLSSIVPGAVFAISFWPIVVGLLFLIPLDPLKMVSIGSITTYTAIIPLTIALFKVKVVPAIGFEDALFSYSTIVVGLNIGVIIVLTVFYILVYSRTLYTSLVMMFRLKMERTSFILGVAMVVLLAYIAIILSDTYSLYLYTIPIVFLHILLVLVNLRIVGEAGTGSQALLPIVTIYLYTLGIRDVATYSTLDPYTGIPMPQVIGGSTMNLIRFGRFFRCNIVKLLLYFGIGILIGSFTTYIYGNILAETYGFDSQYMPLTRWIPTVVWMASIYSGKIGSTPIYASIIGVIVGLVLILIGSRRNIPLFPFAIGICMPPDIGVLSLLVFIIKRMLVRLGVEVHEKMIILSILFLIGSGFAILFNTVLTMFASQG